MRNGIAIGLAVVGTAIVWWHAGFPVTVGVILMLWANNINRPVPTVTAQP